MNLGGFLLSYTSVFQMPKGNTTQFGTDALSFHGAKLWSKFYSELLNKETNLAKSKLPKQIS